MVDLIVPSSTVLRIDANFKIEPRYGRFRMEANSTILCNVDVVLHVDRAEFADGCLIDARGSAGAPGLDAPGLRVAGGPGGPGGAGHSVTIEAGLAQVGALTIAASGGHGGPGGAGQPGSLQAGSHPPGPGGSGGPGGRGGDGGLISFTWTRLAPGLPTIADMAPPGHAYIGAGGAGGSGGTGGDPGENPFTGQVGQPGPDGAKGASGVAVPAKVRWTASMTGLLWVQKQDMGPAPRSAHDVAFDPGRGRLVLLGGAAGPVTFGDTWEWDGQFWIQVAETGPSARSGHAMAYDTAAGRILLFGGRQGDGTLLRDTWAWDGRDWIQLADTGPAPREGHAMAGDPARARVVLFGGALSNADGGGAVLAGDTWEWDQGQWIQLQDVGPPARTGAKLAYDPSGTVTLLFGGASDPRTWAWDGTSWKQVAEMGPSARQGHALSTAGAGVILFGGAPLAVAQAPQLGPRNDTWAWLDQLWRQIQDIGPAPRQGHAMAYDPAGKIIAFGGETAGGTFQGDTWELAQHI
jgi:hypothetical protein